MHAHIQYREVNGAPYKLQCLSCTMSVAAWLCYSSDKASVVVVVLTEIYLT